MIIFLENTQKIWASMIFKILLGLNAVKAANMVIDCNQKEQHRQDKYCGQCGVQTIRVPQDYVYNWMRETYPDIVKNQNDLEGLEKLPLEEQLTLSSIVAKSTIAVAKGGFWAGKWFVKSIAKEIGARGCPTY